jgi:L-lactate dehydrogenase complex protein LldF
VRAEVIARLDEYLQTFSAKAAKNGLIVHRAADADEAVNLVLQIAGTSAAGKLVAKSKSMVSEEIELNHALEREGARVVETDLGEYIVQLRGEKPAHIITPAVHLRRHEVGQLFQEKLGIPFTDDISVLTSAARKLLREVFLTADVGISGVNFGVAETGTLCIVTNEGNGRMVTTVPPVHIALMGMERLVPTLDDLALMLSLLPRSATAQKLTVYTQLLHSPRRPDEVDGALQRHLIIVDNGRSRIRNSRLQESLYCIRCGACLNACPVFREIGGHAYIGADGKIAPYPGPIGSVVSPGLLGLERFGHLAQASSLCGACKDACPVDIDLPRLLTDVRAGPEKPTASKEAIGLSSPSAIGLRAYGVIASSPRLFEAAQSLASPSW